MTALYKVHTIYRKEDVVKMQKLVSQRFQRIYRCAAAVVGVILLAVCYWSVTGGGKDLRVLGMSLTTASVILLLAAAASVVLVELRPLPGSPPDPER